jgi:hypothetical protein
LLFFVGASAVAGDEKGRKRSKYMLVGSEQKRVDAL